MDGNDDSGLLNIALSSSEDEEAVDTQARDYQSEADFQRVKAQWKPKIESGEIWKTLDLPLDDPSKQQGQSILYAVEELYYLQQFGKAVEVVELALKGILGSELRTILLDYEERCLAKQQGHLKP